MMTGYFANSSTYDEIFEIRGFGDGNRGVHPLFIPSHATFPFQNGVLL